MLKPAFVSQMSETMADVYGAVTDRILINLAKYFPFLKAGVELPGSFDYQARMLAQMGQINKETIDIIMSGLEGADQALRQALEASIIHALEAEEPKLRKAAEKGILQPPSVPEVVPGQMQAFQAYYKQSADKLNLVNTVMLESTQAAYTATVSDIANMIARTQTILNVGAGEVVTGVTAYNQAVRESVRKMVSNGITGFVDHGGHHWSPEAYTAMDIRTTMNNVARAATWERNEGYGNDLYQVSWHNGARPLCYPWQGKVISRSDMVREVEDLDGNKVHVYAQSETSYGEPAGLMGINCGHYPMVFIPGISTLYDVPQDEEENAKDYEESQQQRALERKLREEKRDLEVMKAQGASEEEIKAQKERVRKASSDIQTFCDDTGRTRRRDREATPTRATWPKELKEVTRFNGGYIDVNKTPPPKGTVSVAPSIKPPSAKIVASQATKSPPVQITIKGKTDKLAKSMAQSDYDEVVKLIDKSETVSLYDKYGDSCREIRRVKNKGRYNNGLDIVEYDFSNYQGTSKWSTMAHEMGHMFDHHIGRATGLTFNEVDTINSKCVIGSGSAKVLQIVPSSSDEFLSAMRKDKKNLSTILKDASEIAKMKTGTWRNATGGVQDAMDGFFGTQDKNILPWGHGNKYYNCVYNHRIKTFGLEGKLKDAYNSLGMSLSNQAEVKQQARDYDTASELWANVISALTCGGDELDAFNQYMPETVKAAKKIVRGL